MAEAKSTAADKAAADKKAAEDKAASQANERAAASKIGEQRALDNVSQAQEDAVARNEAELKQERAAVEVARKAEDDERDRINREAQEAHEAEEASRPTDAALHLAKVLEGFVDLNGQDVFDEALGVLGDRREADTGDGRKDAARQRRSAAKGDRSATPAGRSAPEKKGA